MRSDHVQIHEFDLTSIKVLVWMYLGQASLTDCYINIEMTLNQVTMREVRLLRC